MKIEVEMTDEHLNLLIKSVEIYARSLMSQADIVADILAEDKYSYDEEDPNRREKFDKWLKDREEMTKNLSAAFCAMFGKYPMKSDTCENLIDMWHTGRMLIPAITLKTLKKEIIVLPFSVNIMSIFLI